MKTKTPEQQRELRVLLGELHWSSLRAKEAGEPLLAMRLSQLTNEINSTLKQIEASKIYE